MKINSNVSYTSFLFRDADEEARMISLRDFHDAMHLGSEEYRDHVWRATTAPHHHGPNPQFNPRIQTGPHDEIVVFLQPALAAAEPARYTAEPSQKRHLIELNPGCSDAQAKVSCIFEVLNAANSGQLAAARNQIPAGEFVGSANNHLATTTDQLLTKGDIDVMPAVMFARACEELEYHNVCAMRTIRDQMSASNLQVAPGVSNQQAFQVYDRWSTFDAYYHEQVLTGHAQHYINHYASKMAPEQQQDQQQPQNYWSMVSANASSSNTHAAAQARQSRAQWMLTLRR